MKRLSVTCMLVALLGAAALWYSELDKASATPDELLAEIASGDPILVGAGDIASCDENGDEKTAKILDRISGTVFTAGDNVYESGKATEYRRCYKPSWGRHKARTRPAPGNHDYRSPDAAPYYDYFGRKAGPAGQGYYSYDHGAWHVISLNSNIAAEEGSPQYEWLREDLAANPNACTAAYWHHAVFSSGEHGNDQKMAQIWKLLDESGVDVALVGHDHDYERFAPQDYAGKVDAKGIRQFVVGTGGSSLRPFFNIQENSEVRNSNTHGVLKLTLHAASYDWEFVPERGATFRDSGSAACVGADPVPPPTNTAPSP